MNQENIELVKHLIKEEDKINRKLKEVITPEEYEVLIQELKDNKAQLNELLK